MVPTYMVMDYYSSYRLYLIFGEITFKQDGAKAQLSERRWAGTRFGRLRFIGARIWSGVSWFQRQSVEVCLDWHTRASGVVPPGSNPLERAKYITRHLRRPFLGECRWGPRHFWECQACLGYGPASDPPKNGLVPYSSGWWDGRKIPITS